MTEDIKFYLENKHFLLDKKWVNLKLFSTVNFIINLLILMF